MGYSGVTTDDINAYMKRSNDSGAARRAWLKKMYPIELRSPIEKYISMLSYPRVTHTTLLSINNMLVEMSPRGESALDAAIRLGFRMTDEDTAKFTYSSRKRHEW